MEVNVTWSIEIFLCDHDTLCTRMLVLPLLIILVIPWNGERGGEEHTLEEFCVDCFSVRLGNEHLVYSGDVDDNVW